jgi:hypothetical protein
MASPLMLNEPSALVVAEREALVRVSVTVTDAPDSGAPVGDKTVPRTEPDVACANPATGKAKTSKAMAPICTSF